MTAMLVFKCIINFSILAKETCFFVRPLARRFSELSSVEPHSRWCGEGGLKQAV